MAGSQEHIVPKFLAGNCVYCCGYRITAFNVALWFTSVNRDLSSEPMRHPNHYLRTPQNLSNFSPDS